VVQLQFSVVFAQNS